MDENVNVKEKSMDGVSNANENVLNIVFALILGIAFDYFFYERMPEISYLLFNVMLLGFFMYSARSRINYKSKSGSLLLAFILLFSAALFIHSNEVLNLLDFLMVPFLIVAYTIIATKKEADWGSIIFVLDMMDRIFIKALSNIFKPILLLRKNSAGEKIEEKHKVWKNILIGTAVSLPVLLFVIPLLMSADMAFEYYINNISIVFEGLNIGRAASHILLISVVFLYILGYAWSFKYTKDEMAYTSKARAGMVEPQILITSLVIINLVYLLFTVVQFSYLYAGGRLPGNFTFSQYARRGFFELIAVAVINLFIMLLSLRLVKKENAACLSIIKILLSLLVGFTINMLYSAHLRMSLYEQSFGYTELRVYVHMFMLFMFIVLLFAVAMVWNKRIQFVKASLICGIVLYAVLNYMNVEGFIARSNIERYRITGKIDTKYLAQLSWDAAPEIIEFVSKDKSPEAQEMKSKLIEKYESSKKSYKWMEYNYSRERGMSMVANNLVGK